MDQQVEQKPKTRKRCYYEVMGVLQEAPVSEIKAQYRKLALLMHPDKSDDPNAKEKFVEIQEAWKILSDVNERTWYDNHREQVLYNKHEMTTEEFDLQTFGFDMTPYMTTECFKDFSDEAGAFYAMYRKAFELIKQEEKKAYQRSQLHKQDNSDDQQGEYRKFPGFGDSKIDLGELKKFYSEWDTFSSYKSFIWANEHNLKEAENRYVRREMEKENKVERAAERKRYITAIKNLVAFAKKRDPRIQNLNTYIAQQQKHREQMKKKKIQEDKARRERLQRQRQKDLEETRLRMEALKTEDQKQKQRQQLTQKPKVQEKRVKLVKHQCATCLEIFGDFNKHFQHLQKSGHSKS